MFVWMLIKQWYLQCVLMCFGLYHRLKDETKDVCIYVCIDTYVMQPLFWVGPVGGDHIYLSIYLSIHPFIYLLLHGI